MDLKPKYSEQQVYNYYQAEILLLKPKVDGILNKLQEIRTNISNHSTTKIMNMFDETITHLQAQLQEIRPLTLFQGGKRKTKRRRYQSRSSIGQ